MLFRATVALLPPPVLVRVSVRGPPASPAGFEKTDALPLLLLLRMPPTSVSVPVPKLLPIVMLGGVPAATTFNVPELRTVLTVVGADAAVPVFRIRVFEMAGEI